MSDRLRIGVSLVGDGRAPHRATDLLLACAPQATVGDVRRALGEPEPLVVDGRRHDDREGLAESGLAHGGHVGPGSMPRERRPGVRAHPPAGDGTAVSAELPTGRGLLAPAPSADLRLPDPAPAVLLDHGPTGVRAASADRRPLFVGTQERIDGDWSPDDHLLAGAWLFDLQPRVAAPQPGGAVPHPFHRPARCVEPAPEAPPTGPTPPVTRPPPEPPGWPSIVLPVLVGLALALVWTPVLAVFTLLGPLMAVTTWLDGRRRARSANRRADADHVAAVVSWRSQVDEHTVADHRRWRSRHPPPGELVRAAAEGGATLWSVRPTTPDAHRLEVGVDHAGRPVCLDLAQTPWAGIVGPPSATHAVGRALLVRVVAERGPADVQVDVHPALGVPGTRWLPHHRPGPRRLYVGPASDVDDHPLGVLVATDVEHLPARCQAVLSLEPDGAVLHDAADQRRTPVTPWRLDAADASVATRGLCRLVDPEVPDAGPAEEGCRLDELLDRGRPTRAATRDRGLAAPVGRAGGDVAWIDLVHDGPHALVAGTTGSGKSELLRTLVTGLAARHDPTELRFALLDFKGGAAFEPLRGLPHVVDVVSDLEPGLADRVLDGLEQEVMGRERWLRGVGHDDLADADPSRRPPRLVLIVDEFATLAADAPDALHALVDLARRGRSLGLHLVLSTQRPAGAVSPEIRANTNLRIALRTIDPIDSTDVLGVPDAASLPADRPGVALLRRGGEPVLAVTIARARAATQAAAPLVEALPASGSPATDAIGSLDVLVDRIAAATTRPRPAAPLWSPPLPSTLPVGGPASDGAAAVGLLDDRGTRSHRTLSWSARRQPLLLVGSANSLPDAVVGAVTAAWKAAHPGRTATHLDRDDGRDVLADLCARRPWTEREPWLIVVRRWHALADVLDDLDGMQLRDALLAEATVPSGLHLLVGSERAAGLPAALRGSALTVVFDLTDPTEYAAFALRDDGTRGDTGRGRVVDGVEVQLVNAAPRADP